jgi:hypothetical protein
MEPKNDAPTEPTTQQSEPPLSVVEQIREATYQAWAQRRGDQQERSRALFDQAYLGHYSHIDHYVETLVDDYQLDSKLDTAIAEPFRAFVDIDITGLARSLARNGTLYCIMAAPLGVWVFNGEVEQASLPYQI